MVGLALLPWQLRHAEDDGQQARFTGAGLLVASLMLTEIQHIGDYASWRLFINLAGATATVYGTWFFWDRERKRSDR